MCNLSAVQINRIIIIIYIYKRELTYNLVSPREDHPVWPRYSNNEAIAQVKPEKKPFFAATLDTRKAFDVVDKSLLLSKLCYLDINGYIWQIINSSYTSPHEVV